MGTSPIAVASLSALTLALAPGVELTSIAQEQNSPLQGVWRVREVVVTGGAPRTFGPEATLVISWPALQPGRSAYRTAA